MPNYQFILTPNPLIVRAIPMGDSWLVLVSGVDKLGWATVPPAHQEALIQHAIDQAKNEAKSDKS